MTCNYSLSVKNTLFKKWPRAHGLKSHADASPSPRLSGARGTLGRALRRKGGQCSRGPRLAVPGTAGPHASPVPTVRLHDSISEEGFHYLVFDL